MYRRQLKVDLQVESVRDGVTFKLLVYEEQRCVVMSVSL